MIELSVTPQSAKKFEISTIVGKSLFQFTLKKNLRLLPTLFFLKKCGTTPALPHEQ